MQVNGKSTVASQGRIWVVFFSPWICSRKKKKSHGRSYRWSLFDSGYQTLIIRKLSKHNEFHHPVHFHHVFSVHHMHLIYSIEINLVLRC